MIDVTANMVKSPKPTKDSVAFTRYADKAFDPKFKDTFQFPTGEPLQRINPGELFRV